MGWRERAGSWPMGDRLLCGRFAIERPAVNGRMLPYYLKVCC